MKEIRCPKCGLLTALGNGKLVEIMKGNKRTLITGNDVAIMADCLNPKCNKSVSIQLEAGSLVYEDYKPKENYGRTEDEPENGTKPEGGSDAGEGTEAEEDRAEGLEAEEGDIRTPDESDTEGKEGGLPEAEDKRANPEPAGEGTPENGSDGHDRNGEAPATPEATPTPEEQTPRFIKK